MKKASFLSAFILLSAWQMSSAQAQNPQPRVWVTHDSVLTAAGDYSDISWPAGVTVIVPQGVTITNFASANPPGFGGGKLKIYGNLTIQTAFQFDDSVIVGNNAHLTVDGNFSTSNVLADTASSITVNGDFDTHFEDKINPRSVVTVKGLVSYHNGGLDLDSAATLNAEELNLSNPNNTIKGTVNLNTETSDTGSHNTGTLIISNSPDELVCPARINAVNLQNDAEANPLTGSGYIVVSGIFSGINPLTASSGIVLNAAGGDGNPGNASIGTASPCTQSLPITLTDFNAYKNKSSVLLEWTTASEINNKGFSVERSADKKNYTQLAFIPSKSSGGNSSSPLDYKYTDDEPLNGVNYYRLVQENINGTSEVYPLNAPIDMSNLLITVFPSPVKNTLSISGAQQGDIFKIINTKGNAVLNSAANKINVSSLASGIYFLQILRNGKIVTATEFIKE